MKRLALITLVASACPTPLLVEGDRCTLNSDCRQNRDGGFPLVCVYGRCHNQCAIDDDCTKPQVCRMSVKPINVCLLRDELACPNGTDRECPGPLVCGPDRTCRDPCKSDRDCLENAICTQGLCALPAEIDAGILPPPTIDAGIDGGLTCRFTSECPVGERCQQGRCQVECLADRDCDRGFECSQNTCVLAASDAGLPVGFGARCDFTSDCSPNLLCADRTCTVECLTVRDCPSSADCCAGFRCHQGVVCTTPFDAGRPSVDGGCLTDSDCQDNALCNGAERCDRGSCRPAPHQICDDGNPCTLDSCIEAFPKPMCGHATTATRPDEDHDGHAPASCGDTADDCDDSNPNVYFGALERCDFLDNDCNGQVDERLWRVETSSAASFSTGNLYHANAGAPTGKRVGNTLYVAANSDATTRGTLDLWQLDLQSFSPTAGPLALGGSQTAWSSCFYQTLPFPGRRSGLGQLAFQPDGGGLVTGVAATYLPNTQMCCEAGNPPIETGFTTPFNGLSAATPTTIVSSAITGNGCNGAFNYYDRPISPASATWSEALGQYIVSWGDKTRASGVFQVLYATVDPVSGVISAPRQVVQSGSGLLGSEMRAPTYLGTFPLVVASPTSVLFIWLQGNLPGDGVRYVVMNPTLTQRLAGPSVLPISNASDRWPTRGEWTGTSFVVLLSGGSTGAVPPVLASIAPSGAHEWFTQLVDGSASAGQPSTLGIRAPDQPTFTLVGARGFMSAVTNGRRFTFSYAPLQGDAGVLSFDYDTGRLSYDRSDPALITVDDRTVLAVWADDNLRRVVLRCVE